MISSLYLSTISAQMRFPRLREENPVPIWANAALRVRIML